MARKAALDREKMFEALFLYRDVADREKLSTRGISELFEKEYGLSIHQSNISRALDKIQAEVTHDSEVAKAYEEWKATKGVSGKIFYRTDPISNKITSDYVTVQAFIDRRTRRPQGAGNITDILQQAEKCWLFLDKKDPANWEIEDVERYLSEGRTSARKPHTHGTKLSYMIACRAVAPRVKAVENATQGYKKEMRKHNPIIKSPVFTKEYKEIVNSSMDYEKRLTFRLHVVTGAREGQADPRASILGLRWEDYDARTETLKVFESKVVGWWNNIPLDVLDPEFKRDFRAYWESKGKPSQGYILTWLGEGVSERYNRLTALYAEIRRSFDFLKGKKFTPHFARKTHVNVLWEAGVPLEIIAGDARAGEGYVGVGWTDIQTLKDYYLSLSKSKLDEYRQKAKEHFYRV